MDIINELEDDVAEHCCKQIINYVMGALMLKVFLELDLYLNYSNLCDLKH